LKINSVRFRQPDPTPLTAVQFCTFYVAGLCGEPVLQIRDASLRQAILLTEEKKLFLQKLFDEMGAEKILMTTPAAPSQYRLKDPITSRGHALAGLLMAKHNSNQTPKNPRLGPGVWCPSR
jgi:hypothetical protein